MNLLMLAPLAGLALVDSMSFGTLGVPVFLLARARIHIRSILGYLVTIATFYWLVGVVLVVGAEGLQRLLADVEGNRALMWIQLGVGIVLFAVSWLFDGDQASARRERRVAKERALGAAAAPTRRDRWKNALVGERPRPSVVAGVALAAGLVEVASMLPYLGAVGIITTSGLQPVEVGAVLAVYVAVMVAPALFLLAVRLFAARAVEPVLTRLGEWLERQADELLGWVLGIVGFLLAADAAQRLDLVTFFG